MGWDRTLCTQNMSLRSSRHQVKEPFQSEELCNSKILSSMVADASPPSSDFDSLKGKHFAFDEGGQPKEGFLGSENKRRDDRYGLEYTLFGRIRSILTRPRDQAKLPAVQVYKRQEPFQDESPDVILAHGAFHSDCRDVASDEGNDELYVATVSGDDGHTCEENRGAVNGEKPRLKKGAARALRRVESKARAKLEAEHMAVIADIGRTYRGLARWNTPAAPAEDNERTGDEEGRALRLMARQAAALGSGEKSEISLLGRRLCSKLLLLTKNITKKN